MTNQAATVTESFSPLGGTTMKTAIERLLTDSRIADVELEGSDGVRLPGCKGLLAARSLVFERMFFGDFAERTEPVVKLGYSGKVLKTVVRYCYTDEIQVEENKGGNEWIHEVMLLTDAANFFELPQLRETIISITTDYLKKNPETSFRFLEEAKCIGCTEVLQEAVLTIQKHLPNLLSLSNNPIRELSAPSLEEVLQDEFSPCEERILYKLLEMWAEGDDRTKSATDLAKHVRCDLIPASILERQVTVGGLVPEKDINAAYREQAKLAEKKMDLLQCRSDRRWKGSKGVIFTYVSEKDTVDVVALEDGRLSSGIYLWSIVVESMTENVFLGVEGGKDDFWIGCNGVKWRDQVHCGQTRLRFNTKSVVTLRLNLTMGGTLAASTDGENFENLYSNMLSTDNDSFAPAVCIKKPGSVRFDGIIRLA